jgi:ribosomal-protein-alanine N-acetyltransferase
MSNLKLVVYNSAMEFANHLSNSDDLQTDKISEVRVAKKSDASAITRLLNSARLTHFHVDWRPPVDWLGDLGFVVVPQEKGVSRQAHMPSLLMPREQMMACLAVTADPLPAAWVRLTAVSADLDPDIALTEMFALVKEHLKETAVTEVGWLVIDPWPLPLLPKLGFELFTIIETYVKQNFDLPPQRSVPDLIIRPVADDDFENLVTLETAVFDPLWRFSEDTFRLARRDSVSFDVAYLGERLVGYQISSGGRFGAHLVRLTTAPELQGQGIGTAIFCHAIQEYQRRGYQHITLNTQVDNDASHHLYEKFGFCASGERMPLWVMPM